MTTKKNLKKEIAALKHMVISQGVDLLCLDEACCDMYHRLERLEKQKPSRGLYILIRDIESRLSDVEDAQETMLECIPDVEVLKVKVEGLEKQNQPREKSTKEGVGAFR